MVSDLLKKYERISTRILKASRIHPDIITRSQRYLITLKALKMFNMLGVNVELRLPEGAKAIHIIPVEAISLAEHVYASLGLKAISIYWKAGRVYLGYVIDDIVELYVVGECMALETEGKEALGEPRVVSGFRGYPPDRVIALLEKMYQNYKMAERYFNMPLVVDGLRKIPEIVERLRDAILVIRWDDRLTNGRSFYHNDRKLISIEVGGERFVAESTGNSIFEDYLLRECEFYYILYAGEVAEKKLQEYLEEKSRAEAMERKMVEAWDKVMARYRDNHVEVTPEELSILLPERDFKDVEKFVEFLRRSCEKIYLVDYMYDGVHYSYVGLGKSYRYPLRILYLLRLLEDFGIEAHIVGRKVGVESLPSIAVRIDRWIYPRSRTGYRPLCLILVPKRDLEIDYPCEVRAEDGCIVAIDGRMLSKALGGG